MVVLSIEEYSKLTERTELRNEFQKLIHVSQSQLQTNKDAWCVIVVKTAKNHIRYCVCMKETWEEDEEAFIQELIQENDMEVRNIVCMANGNSLDPGSYHLKKRLLDICPENADALMILQGEFDSAFRTIGSMMP